MAADYRRVDRGGGGAALLHQVPAGGVAPADRVFPDAARVRPEQDGQVVQDAGQLRRWLRQLRVVRLVGAVHFIVPGLLDAAQARHQAARPALTGGRARPHEALW